MHIQLISPPIVCFVLGIDVEPLVNVLKDAVNGISGDVCFDGSRDDTWWRDSCYHENQSLMIQMNNLNAIEAVYITTLELCK